MSNIDVSTSAPTTSIPCEASAMATRPVPQPASSTVAGSYARTNVASPCTSAPEAARRSKRAW